MKRAGAPCSKRVSVSHRIELEKNCWKSLTCKQARVASSSWEMKQYQIKCNAWSFVTEVSLVSHSKFGAGDEIILSL